MGIVVVTHNGMLPKDGGKRIGYVVDGTPYRIFLPIGSTALIPLVPPEPPKPSLASYEVLPMARYADGKCVNCGHYPNYAHSEEFEGGRRAVLVCSRCKKRMRPFAQLPPPRRGMYLN